MYNIQRRSSCLKKITIVNARIPAAATETAKPVRIIITKTAQEQTAEKTGSQKARSDSKVFLWYL